MQLVRGRRSTWQLQGRVALCLEWPGNIFGARLAVELGIYPKQDTRMPLGGISESDLKTQKKRYEKHSRWSNYSQNIGLDFVAGVAFPA